MVSGNGGKRGDESILFDKKQGRLNRLSDDGTFLIEEHAKVSCSSISEDEKLLRYVFSNYNDMAYRNGKVEIVDKGGYRFLGIFQIDLENFNFLIRTSDISKKLATSLIFGDMQV